MADKAKGFTFTWKIENMSMLQYENGQCLSSPYFEVDMCENGNFFLAFYPKGVKNEPDYATCFLTYEGLCDVPNLKIKVYFVIQSIETTDAIVSKTLVFPPQCTELGIGNLFEVNEIYEKKHLYLPNDVLTLRCHILSTDEACVESNENELVSKRYFTQNSCVCRSVMPVGRRSAIWSIRNINKLGELVERYFVSAFDNTPSFKLSIKFGEITTSEFVPIEIRQIDDCLEIGEILVKCKITVISAHKEHEDFSESAHYFSTESDVWKFPPFIKVSSLTRDEYLFLDDTLHLKCEFVFSFEHDKVHHLEDSCIPLTLETRRNDKAGELSTSIEKCYSSGKYCDIQLRADGQIFPAHKLVLGARSTVFSAMFENDMKEKSSGVVDIVDIDPITLKRMLAFLYDEDITDDLSGDACELYVAADKYDIASLKHQCRVSLISSLSVASVCDVLFFADLHQDNLLLNVVKMFFCRHADEIFHSSYWRRLMDDNSKLAADVMHKMLIEKNGI